MKLPNGRMNSCSTNYGKEPAPTSTRSRGRNHIGRPTWRTSSNFSKRWRLSGTHRSSNGAQTLQVLTSPEGAPGHSLDGNTAMSRAFESLIPDATEDIRPFHISVPQEAIADLRARLRATRFPNEQPVNDWSQGVPLAQ